MSLGGTRSALKTTRKQAAAVVTSQKAAATATAAAASAVGGWVDGWGELGGRGPPGDEVCLQMQLLISTACQSGGILLLSLS